MISDRERILLHKIFALVNEVYPIQSEKPITVVSPKYLNGEIQEIDANNGRSN